MIKVNAMGENCPIPVIKTKQAISDLTGPETIEVLVDNETAVQNVSKYGKNAGGQVSTEQISAGEYKVVIKMDGAISAAELSAPVECKPESNGDTVVVISSDRMGEGNDELGKVLIKGFIYALSQLPELPKQIIFYNGGASLTARGSDSLADLKDMEERGTEILTCGTCLDYYGLKDKLEVGSVTNMYSIVEALNDAGKILKP